MNLLPVRSTDPTDLPWAPNSIYKFSSENRYPEIIIRLDGKLFFDMDAFEKLVRKTRDAQVERAKTAKRGIEAESYNGNTPPAAGLAGCDNKSSKPRKM